MMVAMIVGMVELEVVAVRRNTGRRRLGESENMGLVDSCEVL
jgi:hypothetical protein